MILDVWICDCGNKRTWGQSVEAFATRRSHPMLHCNRCKKVTPHTWDDIRAEIELDHSIRHPQPDNLIHRKKVGV